MSDDLRTLAQAVVRLADSRMAGLCDALKALEAHLGHEVTIPTARAILAADAQGYARAMGEVDGLLESWVKRSAPGGDEHYALTTIRGWARERLPAAAERD